jgi:hypothetical protein
MYGVAGEKRPIFVESDAFLYNLGDPMLAHTLKYAPARILMYAMAGDSYLTTWALIIGTVWFQYALLNVHTNLF